MSLGRGRGPRRDDEWCLINPFVLGARADVIFHHDRLVAPAPGPGSQGTSPTHATGAVCAITLSTVLSLAVTGVLAGCRSLTAIWEHATDLTGADLEALGLAAGQALPSESTIRRVLQNLDPADVDAHLRSWLCTRTGTIEGRTVIAVDGKTMRGARTSKDPAPHLLAALDHATGAVLTQQRVAGKSNEIPALRELLEPLDLEGVVVSADAMHTQTGTAQWIRDQGGHYLLTPLGNQKTLRETLKARPFKSAPSVSSVDTGHGRRVRRTVKAVEAPAWVDFPAAAQVVQA